MRRRLGLAHERAAGHGHRGRVRHLGARSADRQPDDAVEPGGERLGGGRGADAAPSQVGLRGGVAAARRPRVRPLAGAGARPQRPRRGHRDGQRHPHQRRPALRRPRAPRVLDARGHQPARHRPVGQGGGAGDGRGVAAGGAHPGPADDPAVQEQHRRQGRLLRVARELPHGPQDAVHRHHPGAGAVLRHPAGVRGIGPGRHRHRGAHAGLPAVAAGRLLRGRGRAGDDAQAADHQHPRRAARRRRQVPAPARDHRRREPGRAVDLPEGGDDVARAGDDRGAGAAA